MKTGNPRGADYERIGAQMYKGEVIGYCYQSLITGSSFLAKTEDKNVIAGAHKEHLERWQGSTSENKVSAIAPDKTKRKDSATETGNC